MSLMNLDRVHILHEAINRAFKGESVHDIVGALESVIVDVLTALPGMTETMTLSAFDAVAADVRNIIAERFAIQGKGH